jgi:hypothetical protein
MPMLISEQETAGITRSCVVNCARVETGGLGLLLRCSLSDGLFLHESREIGIRGRIREEAKRHAFDCLIITGQSIYTDRSPMLNHI